MSNCRECGMHIDPPDAYHPFLFCELVKAGHGDPAGYLLAALPNALLLMPSRVGQNVADHFQIVKREVSP